MKQIVQTLSAPQAIGPYSQAIITGKFIYTSGQIAIDPETGELIAGGVTEQTDRALRNLAAILSAAGCGLERVIKTTVFLRDMNEFAAMNEVYGKYFSVDPPARSTVEVARLPRDARVEIESIARIE